MKNKQKQDEIIVSTATPVTELVYQPRRLNFFSITEQELDNLSDISASSSIYLGFALFCLAVLLSFVVSIVTVDLSSPTKFAVFVAIAIMAAILTIFFGIMWIRSIGRASKARNLIKQR